MLRKTTRIALLGSVAAFTFSTAYAQTDDPEACVDLADRLSNAEDVEKDVRTEVEDVIATGDEAQCQIVADAWEQEGTIDRETLEMVGSESVSERMIVQQEIEVDADVAVYQPPAEVDVDTGQPEAVWTMPRQSATVDEQAPQITIRQGRPTISVELPQPRVTVMIPEPEVVVTWPESSLDMSDLEPKIEVRIPEPTVSVNMPDPVIELTIGGEGPKDLVELEDGRFAPEGSSEKDLEPRISIQQSQATVSRGGDSEAPEIVFNRGELQVTYESEDPEVTVDVVGEPEIEVSAGEDQSKVTVRKQATEGDQSAEGENGRSDEDEAVSSEQDTADEQTENQRGD